MVNGFTKIHCKLLQNRYFYPYNIKPEDKSTAYFYIILNIAFHVVKELTEMIPKSNLIKSYSSYFDSKTSYFFLKNRSFNLCLS